METQSRQGLQNPGYLRAKGENGYYAGEAALTERRVGKGRVLHLGRAFSGNSLPELLTYAGVLSPFMELIEADGSDAELSLRQKNGRYFLFVLNFRPVEISFILKKKMRFLYHEKEVSGPQTLPAFGTAVYEVL